MAFEIISGPVLCRRAYLKFWVSSSMSNISPSSIDANPWNAVNKNFDDRLRQQYVCSAWQIIFCQKWKELLSSPFLFPLFSSSTAHRYGFPIYHRCLTARYPDMSVHSFLRSVLHLQICFILDCICRRYIDVSVYEHWYLSMYPLFPHGKYVTLNVFTY